MSYCPKCKKYDWVAIDVKKLKKVCMKCHTVWDLKDHEVVNILKIMEKKK